MGRGIVGTLTGSEGEGREVMPTFTDQQAQAYYQTLNPQQQAAVDASGGPSVAWLTNAVNAGVPDAIMAAGGTRGGPQGGNYENQGGQAGASMPFENAAEPSEWMGKRKPTVPELRKWAAQQHAGYLAGDKSKQDEDYARYSDRVLIDQINRGWNASAGGWDKGWGTPGAGVPGQKGRRGGGGRGGGGYRAGSRVNYSQTGGASPALPAGGPTPPPPEFSFTAPTWEQAMEEPGYQFAVKEGTRALQGSAAARGLLRSSGTLKDMIDYGQEAAGKQYSDVWNREYDVAKSEFAPKYGAWQTQYGGDLQKWQNQYQGDLSKWQTKYGGNLAKWQTNYGGDLQKYLQRENNIYGLINTPPWGG